MTARRNGLIKPAHLTGLRWRAKLKPFFIMFISLLIIIPLPTSGVPQRRFLKSLMANVTENESQSDSDLSPRRAILSESADGGSAHIHRPHQSFAASEFTVNKTTDTYA
jgi:hypothetical protein